MFYFTCNHGLRVGRKIAVWRSKILKDLACFDTGTNSSVITNDWNETSLLENFIIVIERSYPAAAPQFVAPRHAVSEYTGNDRRVADIVVVVGYRQNVAVIVWQKQHLDVREHYSGQPAAAAAEDIARWNAEQLDGQLWWSILRLPQYSAGQGVILISISSFL